MYSDSTHFVYEILQNADDYGATIICFKLSKNAIVIEHNGEPFTEKNVEAITYFGKSTSRDVLVKTGRFGVGFKSVFAFTAIPTIISGNEHFQIDGLYRVREYPYPDGFSRSRTRIVLPFNHESEQPDFVEKLVRREEAYTQISECLTTLDLNTLLFTRNIQEIRWEIENHSACYRREDEMDANVRFTTITDGKQENQYVALSKVPKWENQPYKAVEIAFMIDAQERLSPIEDDSLYVLFKTKEKTGLKFMLNGPYRTNPARETISITDDFNLHLMKLTCELLKESLPYLRGRNFLTIEFLSVLPNQEDVIPEFYTPLRDTIVHEFQNEKITPTKRGDYEAASKLYQDRSGRGLSSLIQDEDLAILLGKDKATPLWVANTSQLTQKRDERSGRFVQDTNAQRRNKRIEDFLSMLHIREWKIEDLIRVLELQSNLVMEWLKEKSEIWHQRFYALLDDFISSIRWNYIEGQQYRTSLETLRIVRCSDGRHRSGRECYFLNGDAEPEVDLFNDVVALEEETQLQIQEEDGHEEYFFYVAKGVYSSGQNKDQQKKAHEFLETIGVREVDEVERIKVILNQRYTRNTSGLIKPREADLERFIKLVEADSAKAKLFTSYPILQIDKDSDNKRMWASPKKTFLDSPYLDTGLKSYFEAIDEVSEDRKWPLSLKYKTSGVDLARFAKFAEAVGTQTKLQPTEQRIPRQHPEYHYLVENALGQWRSDTGTNKDYTISECKILIENPTTEKSRLIWLTMCSLPESYLKAVYQCNQSHRHRGGHSSLVHELRKVKWVPQKNGDSTSFERPCNASVELLLEGFQYDKGQAWLEAVEFGKTAREQETEYILLNERAQEIGFDSADEAEKMAEIANEFRAQGKSLDELEGIVDNIRRKERRKELLIIGLSHAEESRYEDRARRIRISRASIDPRTRLIGEYSTGINEIECQMCRQAMPFKKYNSHEDYFEAVEALNKKYFPKEHEAQYLALCPECAARYKEYVKRRKKARKTLYRVLRDSDDPEVLLEINDSTIRIQFKEKHWQDIKTVVFYYENLYESED